MFAEWLCIEPTLWQQRTQGPGMQGVVQDYACQGTSGLSVTALFNNPAQSM